MKRKYIEMHIAFESRLKSLKERPISFPGLNENYSVVRLMPSTFGMKRGLL